MNGENQAAPIIVQESSITTVDVDQALQEWKAYQEITEKMLDETDYQNIKGRMFKKKSAWRKYARVFNINTEIIEKEIIKTEKTGAVKEASFVVRATLPTGRYADGWGNCSRQEGNKAHPNHDIPATAMTRATNRAIADLIGAGEVTAEEIQAELRFQARENARSKLKKPVKPDVEKEVDVVDAEIIENDDPVEKQENSFTTADKIGEPLQNNPLIETYAKNVAIQVRNRGLSINQRNMKLKAEGMLKRGEIPQEYEVELIQFIEGNCPKEEI